MITKYPKVYPGDQFVCLKDIPFIDGTKHIKGHIYIADEKSCSYYSVNHKNYKKINFTPSYIQPEESHSDGSDFVEGMIVGAIAEKVIEEIFDSSSDDSNDYSSNSNDDSFSSDFGGGDSGGGGSSDSW